MLSLTTMNTRSKILFIPFFVVLMLVTGCERERIIFPDGDIQAPLPPAGLLVEGAHDGYIFTGWLKNSESDLAGYIVYRGETDPGNAFTPLDTITQNYFRDVMRSYDTTYYYFVTAIDVNGNESKPSDTVSAQSPNRYRPEVPYSIAVTGHNIGERRFFRIEWSPVDEADLSGYLVFRSDLPFSEPSPSLFIDVCTNTFYTDTTVGASNRRWYYAVTSIDNGGIRSDLSRVDSDFITEKPLLLEPGALGPAKSFPLFRWKSVDQVSRYLVVISTEEYTGELWSGIVNDNSTDVVEFQYFGAALSIGRTYFWRVASISKTDTRPNAISEAGQFYIVQ